MHAVFDKGLYSNDGSRLAACRQKLLGDDAARLVRHSIGVLGGQAGCSVPPAAEKPVAQVAVQVRRQVREEVRFVKTPGCASPHDIGLVQAPAEPVQGSLVSAKQ